MNIYCLHVYDHFPILWIDKVAFCYKVCIFDYSVKQKILAPRNASFELLLSTSVLIKLIFSANQLLCWAHADSFLTFPLLSMPKPLIFEHTQTHQNLSGNTVQHHYQKMISNCL